MASSTDRQKLVEDKKHELLRRIAEKKKNEQTKQSNENFSTEGSSQTASKGGAMFLNDGNFLARFQAMQQQNTQSAASLCSNTAGASGVTSDPRPAVSLKLTTVKKTTPAKTVATRPDIFEAPEDVEENGKFEISFILSMLNAEAPLKVTIIYTWVRLSIWTEMTFGEVRFYLCSC